LTTSIKNFKQFIGLTFTRFPACLIIKWAHFQHLFQYVTTCVTSRNKLLMYIL